jgi:hypothetical protein
LQDLNAVDEEGERLAAGKDSETVLSGGTGDGAWGIGGPGEDGRTCPEDPCHPGDAAAAERETVMICLRAYTEEKTDLILLIAQIGADYSLKQEVGRWRHRDLDVARGPGPAHGDDE